MALRPQRVRVHTFIDAQNLYVAVKESFKYQLPNFDPVKLSEAVTNMMPNRELAKVHLYTGIHAREENQFWHDYWRNKLRALENDPLVNVFTKTLLYHDIKVKDESGREFSVRRAEEKGIDLRIGLDLVRLAVNGTYDVAIIFSQDSDLEEAVNEVHTIRQYFDRWIYLESAFPENPTKLPRGIRNTQWRMIVQDIYDACIDPQDYRPFPTSRPADFQD